MSSSADEGDDHNVVITITNNCRLVHDDDEAPVSADKFRLLFKEPLFSQFRGTGCTITSLPISNNRSNRLLISRLANPRSTGSSASGLRGGT